MSRSNTVFSAPFSALLLTLAVGCADAPSHLDPLTNGSSTLGLATVSQSEWESAPAGCEDADFTLLELFVCAEEPSLGALVANDGKVVCVDSLDLLIEELAAGSTAADPSPQPSHPGRPDMDSGDPAPSALPGDTHTATFQLVSDDGTYGDPTPTPVTNPTFELLTSLFADVEHEGEEEDPTPTPTTEQ